MTGDTPQPLTPEELYRLNADHEYGHLTSWGDVHRLLATLDRDRARIAALEGAARAVVATVSSDGSYIPHAPRHFDAIAALAAMLTEEPRHEG